MRFHAPFWRCPALGSAGVQRTRGHCCASLAPPHACPACCPNIGMAADATFPCRTTDSRASLTCFRFQLESSATRSVASACLHWSPATRSNLNVIIDSRDPRLGGLAPFQFYSRLHTTIVCYLQRPDSKYHDGAGLVPEAWSHVSPSSPIAPKVEMPRKTGGLHFTFSALCLSAHCTTS